MVVCCGDVKMAVFLIWRLVELPIRGWLWGVRTFEIRSLPVRRGRGG
jgi:hypothetical protein